MPPSSITAAPYHEPGHSNRVVWRDVANHCLAAACQSLGFDQAQVWRVSGETSTKSSLLLSWEQKLPPQHLDATPPPSSSPTRAQSIMMCSKGVKEKAGVWISDKSLSVDTVLNTAVAIPCHNFEEQEEYCVLFFAVERIESSPEKISLLQLLCKAAVMASNTTLQTPAAHPHSTTYPNTSESIVPPPPPSPPKEELSPQPAAACQSSASDIEAEMAAMLAGLGPEPERRRGLQWNDLTHLKLLSETETSSVFTAKLGSEVVIVKTVKKECHRMEMENEIDLMAKLNHYHIASFVGSCQDPNGHRAVVMELCDGGGLDQRLGFAPTFCGGQHSDFSTKNYKKPFSYPEVLRYAYELADTLRYLHDEAIPGYSIVHRDLKPDNICFMADGTLKLIDFGVAKIIPKSTKDHEKYQMTTGTGSMRYMAPEVALGSSYNGKVDVYSFAFVVWAMATMKKPFEKYNQTEFVGWVIRGGSRPPRSRKWPKRFRSLLEACWHANPDKRPSFKEVVDTLESLREDADTAPSKPPSRWSLLINRHTCHF